MMYKIKSLRDIQAEQWIGDPLRIEPLGLYVYPEIDSHAVFHHTKKGLVRVEILDWIVLLPCGMRICLSDSIFRKLFRPQEIIE